MEKGKLKNFFKKVFNNAIVRGIVKSIPFGNVVYEVGENISHEVKENDDKKPHHWFSITIQLLCLVGIVYAFLSKSITVEQLVDLLKSLKLE